MLSINFNSVKFLNEVQLSIFALLHSTVGISKGKEVVRGLVIHVLKWYD